MAKHDELMKSPLRFRGSYMRGLNEVRMSVRLDGFSDVETMRGEKSFDGFGGPCATVT